MKIRRYGLLVQEWNKTGKLGGVFRMSEHASMYLTVMSTYMTYIQDNLNKTI